MKYFNYIKLLAFIMLLVIGGCQNIDPILLKSGVSTELAQLRDKQISNIKYQLAFKIPNEINDQVIGHEIIEFDYNEINKNPLILDFRNPNSFVKNVKIDGKEIYYTFRNEHIILKHNKIVKGKNKIEIEFIAGNRALNRNQEYLYTLFVPDRACTAFPSFDQPSLKAKFQLEITVPKEWLAITNTELIETKLNKDQKTFIFDESEPISTYLFSFVAGKFEAVTKTYDDRKITMYHRESNKEKLDRNVEKIFDLKYNSLKWLEEYTKIKYPFKKLDFIIIPSFQYSGMEHPGAVLYRDSKMFLDESASIRDELNRANLIAHETAHMWFGDLVTMKWFSEVWLKEVFANFMAGKIINPQYPDINHDLNFLINHYPASYTIDRTKGANPIGQKLDNMKNAGTLYGSIIYHKAPIVMNHLEIIMGEEKLQLGLQEYLSQNKYDNASWDELIQILNPKTDFDLNTWSKSWVYESGMPNYMIHRAYNTDNKLLSVIIEQTNPSKGVQWTQNIEAILAKNFINDNYNIELTDTFNVIELDKPEAYADFIFPNSNGLGYGYFKLDSISKEKILKQLPQIKDPVLRCSMYISLWENMLNKNILPNELIRAFIKSLKIERNAQNANLILGYSETIFWKFLTIKQRESISNELESFLWEKTNTESIKSIKSSFFKAYCNIANSNESLNKLYKIWNNEIVINDLNLSENNFNDIAFELAIKDYENKFEILNNQLNRIENKEKKERFNFIKNAIVDRDNFFNSLKDENNREKEPWVIDALYYLHHPLKSSESVKYIRPSLDLLEELQITGDIFFPKQWLDATFSGHSSIDAVTEINLFLNKTPDFPENLKNKILQSTDLVFKSFIIKNE